MALDFTLDKYVELCRTALDQRYALLTVADYLTVDKLPGKFIILRHDIDRKIGHALRMAEIENRLGVRATYYFRYNRSTFRPAIIGAIADMGHEIGYHYEVLDKARGDHERALQLFRQELQEFRKIAPVTTAAAHGSPLSRWDNRDLWQDQRLSDLDLKGEAYLSVDYEQVMYYSDTGRTWQETRSNIRDRVPASKKCLPNKPVVTSTDELISLLKSDPRNLYLVAHSERWSADTAGWVGCWLSDTAVNCIKLVYRGWHTGATDLSHR